jgi:hypothetical protein
MKFIVKKGGTIPLRELHAHSLVFYQAAIGLSANPHKENVRIKGARLHRSGRDEEWRSPRVLTEVTVP